MKIMQLVLALPNRREQTRRFQYFQVLRDRLSRESEPMLHGQTRAQLEQSLTVAFHQFVENGPARWSRDPFENIAHGGYL